MERIDIQEGKILMRKNDFWIADMYNAKSILLQIQEQMANCDDYTDEEIRMLIRYIESKKEQCKDIHIMADTMASCQFNSSSKYEHIYRSVYNSLADAFRDSYQLACALIRELNIRRERLRKTE